MILNKSLLIILLCGFVCCLLTSITKAADVPDPTEQLKPLIEKMSNIINKAVAENKIDIALSQRLIEVSREHFDYHEMTKRVLGRSWRNLSEQEQDEFVELFTQLLQHAYISKIENFTGGYLIFKSQRIRGNRAEVRTELVERTRTIKISYIMLLKGERWMVYDLVVEGVSLIRNYMEQFRRIIHRESVEVLKQKMREKIKRLDDEKKQRDKN